MSCSSVRSPFLSLADPIKKMQCLCSYVCFFFSYNHTPYKTPQGLYGRAIIHDSLGPSPSCLSAWCFYLLRTASFQRDICTQISCCPCVPPMLAFRLPGIDLLRLHFFASIGFVYLNSPGEVVRRFFPTRF